ncbi:MAG: uracil-DNA glycosylase [Pseudomonadota bacterium]|nr:uracil-DNA glycosylase [Gammaproteobacteria bacterium]MBU1558533.1 uracil-DNA glycosylase [Gammaproteobacteria bacterium]MBU1629408.1 uracil-DNA glycosylase [Gammaproteobacteria bacterium]MBU1926558.1 uracil-DNA glycosylase [Gammaproteobacteria bacterium]MBU2546614.1 uracil-DNA glycosylase [Gammaproteobacteria bacterium]
MDKRTQYLQAMDIPLWEERNAPAHSMDISPQPPASTTTWIALQEEVAVCTKCDLNKTRTHTVFGIGNQKAQLVIIGEAPGANEDKQGIPFVGRAGMLLTSMLQSIGLHREDVFIANVLKCRPPNNRDPSLHEVELCTPYLLRQLEHIQPRLIVAVGRIAAHYLLNTQEALSRLRGKLHHYGEQSIPLWVTFHPAYLLRSPKEKARAYVDLLKIRELLEQLP